MAFLRRPQQSSAAGSDTPMQADVASPEVTSPDSPMIRFNDNV
jgi:hypothetical protein